MRLCEANHSRGNEKWNLERVVQLVMLREDILQGHRETTNELNEAVIAIMGELASVKSALSSVQLDISSVQSDLDSL